MQDPQPTIKVTKLPPGPDRPELHFSDYLFEDPKSRRSSARPRYGLNPEVLPNSRVPVTLMDGSRRNGLAQASSPPRLLKAQQKGEAWATSATRETIRRLPERYRVAMTLFYWETMEHQEICRLMGLKENPGQNTCSLWAVLHRARRRLAQMQS